MSINRRTFLKTGAATAIAGSTAMCSSPVVRNSSKEDSETAKTTYQEGKSPWPISLDTATIGWGELEQNVEVAHQAGFDAIEPWMRQLEEYEEKGGDLKKLGKQITDRGMFVPSIIGLWDAIPTDPDQFEESLKETRRRMQLASDLGARQVQTIPEQEGSMDLEWAGDAYREILTIGLEEYDIHPALVFVKFFTIKTLEEAVYVAMNANHPEARIIPDTYHMYLSGSSMTGFRHLNGDFIAILQFNDAPEKPAKDKLEDSDRVMPGDGVLPLKQLLRDLQTVGFDRAVSLEMYNPKYQDMDSGKAAKIGLKKTVRVIHQALK